MHGDGGDRGDPGRPKRHLPGEIPFADPNLEGLGLGNYRVPFTLILAKDGEATMTYKYQGSFEYPTPQPFTGKKEKKP